MINNQEKQTVLIEKINDILFKIEDINDKILKSKEPNSEYALKSEGYILLLNDYISIKNALEQALENLQ